MTTINISLPEKLKLEVDTLVKKGVYVSFSDAVRDNLREGLRERLKINRYEKLLAEAKQDIKAGRGRVFTSKKQIHDYLNSLI